MQKAVAISEEFANDATDRLKAGGLLFDRKVVRIVTPGTLIDEKFMNPCESNFLLSITGYDGDKHQLQQQSGSIADQKDDDEPILLGLAWVDLSSGDFFLQQSNIASLPSVIAAINPRQIILDTSVKSLPASLLSTALRDEAQIITYHDSPPVVQSVHEWNHLMMAPFSNDGLDEITKLELDAGTFLLSYVTNQLQGAKLAFKQPVIRHESENMIIDKNTLRALEVRSTIHDGTFAGSLLHSVRKTVTKSGARLLHQRLSKSTL